MRTVASLKAVRVRSGASRRRGARRLQRLVAVTVATANKGTRASVKFPSGVVNTMTYDGSDRLATLITKNAATTTTFVNQTYSYALGTANTSILQKMTDAVTAGNTTTYGYDDLNRLTTATRSGTSWAYTYDRNGTANVTTWSQLRSV